MKRRLLLDTWNNPRAVAFDGTTSYAELARPSALNGLTQWSVSCWLRFPTVPESAPVLNLLTGATGASGWSFDKAGASLSYALRAHFTTAGVKTIFGTGHSISAGVWVHLLLSYDGATLRGYLNGTLLATTHAVASDTLNWGSDSALRLARRGSVWVAMAADELSLWDRAITPALVRQPTRGRPRDLRGQAGLRYWWRLGDRFVAGSGLLPAAWPSAGPALTWHAGDPATQLIAGA